MLTLSSLYPLACFASHCGGMFSNLYLSLGFPMSHYIRVWTLLGLSTIGLVNFACFVLDPAVAQAFLPDPGVLTADLPSFKSSIEEGSRPPSDWYPLLTKDW